jgi:hypothetical protein
MEQRIEERHLPVRVVTVHHIIFSRMEVIKVLWDVKALSLSESWLEMGESLEKFWVFFQLFLNELTIS